MSKSIKPTAPAGLVASVAQVVPRATIAGGVVQSLTQGTASPVSVGTATTEAET